MPVWISRSGKCPWRTIRRRPAESVRCAYASTKPATSASTACPSKRRAPRRKTSVSGSSSNDPGWRSWTTVSSLMAYPSFVENGDSNIARIRRPHLIPSPTFGYSSRSSRAPVWSSATSWTASYGGGATATTPAPARATTSETRPKWRCSATRAPRRSHRGRRRSRRGRQRLVDAIGARGNSLGARPRERRRSRAQTERHDTRRNRGRRCLRIHVASALHRDSVWAQIRPRSPDGVHGRRGRCRYCRRFVEGLDACRNIVLGLRHPYP